MKDTREIRRKKVRRNRRILGVVSSLLGVGGFFLLICAEGGAKSSMTSASVSVTCIVAGLIMIGLGFAGAWILDATASKKKVRK